MKTLTFAPANASLDGGRVRAARFETRSGLPVSAACMVASGVRETLSALFGTPIATRLLEPTIPSAHAWPVIAGEAILYRLRGSVADAAIVLRPADAAALAAAAFGEREAVPETPRPLSRLERDVLDRAANAIAGALPAVCGAREHEALERAETIGGFATYFEILLERPVEARIGIALSRDPSPEPHGRVAIDDLAAVTLTCAATLDLSAISAGTLSALAPGAIVPAPRAGGLRGRLRAGEATLVRGTFGARDGRYALLVDAS